MKQTAVEWLYRWFIDNPEATHEEGNKALKQAKEMEKGQHATTWGTAISEYKERGEVFIRAWEDFDDYYNEITKKLE